MPKADKLPTKHGLDRKFKPWRRGKSQNSNKRSSLKQQLRGHERLLAKVDDEERRKELEAKIEGLRSQIDGKKRAESDQKNAVQSHGRRFLERQKLVRMERKAVKDNDTDDLLRIALDQAYVAHHPRDVKYMALFGKKGRVMDHSRQLYRRAVTRRRILKEIANGTQEKVPWISADQYARLPLGKEWTIQDEEKTFGGSITREAVRQEKKTKKEKEAKDDRFGSTSHDALLEAADKIEAELDKGEEGNEKEDVKAEKDATLRKNSKEAKAAAVSYASHGTDSDGSLSASEDSDGDDDADPLSSQVSKAAMTKSNTDRKEFKTENPSKKRKMSQGVDSDSDSSSDDSSNDDDEEELKNNPKTKIENKKAAAAKKSDDSDSSDSSDSDSDSDSDSSAETKTGVTEKFDAKDNVLESDQDDFLMDAASEDEYGKAKSVFDQAKEAVPTIQARGDKSKGWATQKQLPGQFKKKRTRR